MLHDIGCDVREFLQQESKWGTLGAAGWTESSLTHLFATDLTDDIYNGPRQFGFPSCERCGQNGTTWRFLTVDLRWRRRLREIRQDYAIRSLIGTQDSQSLHIVIEIDRKDTSDESSEDPWLIPAQDLANKSDKHLPYRIVCSAECMDGVCVAWLYENDLKTEPSFPLFPQEPATAEELDGDKMSGVKADEYPEVKVPGAFVD